MLQCANAKMFIIIALKTSTHFDTTKVHKSNDEDSIKFECTIFSTIFGEKGCRDEAI